MIEEKRKDMFFSKKIYGKEMWEWIAIFTCFFVVVMWFSITWEDKFTVQDTFRHYEWARKRDYISMSLQMGKEQGRFMYILYNFLSECVYTLDNIIIYNFISFLSISFGAYAIWKILNQEMNKKIAYIAVILFWSFAQVDWQHNFFVSYIGPLQWPIGFALLSFSEQLLYYKDSEKKHLIKSAILIVIASSFYECFILYTVFNAVICLGNCIALKNISLKKLWNELKYYIIFMALYLLLYGVFRIFYPSAYEPNTPANTGVLNAIKVMITYGLGLFPGRRFIDFNNKKVLISQLKSVDFIQALIVMMVIKILFSLVGKVKIKRGMLFAAGAFALAFTSCFLYGITSRHVEWVGQGVTSYGASFYSYYFIIITISLCMACLCSLFKNKKIVLLVLSVICACVALMTSATNRYYSTLLSEQYERLNSMKQFGEANIYRDIEDGSYVVVPIDFFTSVDYHFLLAEWDDIYTDKQIYYVSKLEDVPQDSKENMWLLKSVDNNAWVLAQIDAEYNTERLKVYPEKFNKEYSIKIEGNEAESKSGQISLNDNIIWNFKAEKRQKEYVIEGKFNVESISIQVK